jgi:hypothetical protein
MRKLISCAALLLVIVMLFTTPAYAADVATDEAETVDPTVTEEATENATEGNVEATEATTEEETAEEVTEAPTEEETETAPVGIVDGLPAEADRDWLINAIKTAKPDEVEFIKGYIEDALVAMEGIEYTEWEWVYKIIADNAEWIACLAVGLGFLAAAVVMIIKYRREKTLINNAAGAANASEEKMAEMVQKVAEYDERINTLTETVAQAILLMQTHDGKLAAAEQELIKRDETVIANDKLNVNAMILLADVVGDLIQISSVPQIRKDELYSRHATAKNNIIAQTMGGERHDESED